MPGLILLLDNSADPQCQGTLKKNLTAFEGYFKLQTPTCLDS